MHRFTRRWALLCLALLLVPTAAYAHGKRFGPWGAPVNLQTIPETHPDVNTPYLDGCPILSPDGLELYMASDRPGGEGGLDIWVARRTSKHSAFGAPENLGKPINSAQDDFCPSPMRGNLLFFVSGRPGGCGGADIYVSRKEDGVYEAPLHINCSVNSAAGEASPYLLERKGRTWLYFSSDRPGGFAADVGVPDADIYVSELGRFGFGPAELAPGLNTASNDARPNLRHDGLEIVFDSNRLGTMGGPDIFASTRGHVTDAWDVPVNLGPTVNSTVNDTRASLSWDGRTLAFGSNRPGGELSPAGTTSNDIYMSTRERGGNSEDDD